MSLEVAGDVRALRLRGGSMRGAPWGLHVSASVSVMQGMHGLILKAATSCNPEALVDVERGVLRLQQRSCMGGRLRMIVRGCDAAGGA